MTLQDCLNRIADEKQNLIDSNLHLRRLLAAAVRWNHGSLVVHVIKHEDPTIISIADRDSDIVTITLGKEDK